MEKFPPHHRVPESIETTIPRKQVIEAILKHGKEEEQVIKLYRTWIDQLQSLRTQDKITDYACNLAIAELLKDAGLVEDAIVAFRDTTEVAHGSRLIEEAAYCDEEVRRLQDQLDSSDK